MMSDTSSNLPICIHCGTARPADETNCPTCGKPWIDVRVAPPQTARPLAEDPSVAAAAAAGVGASAAAAQPSPPDAPQPDDLHLHDTGEFGMDEWTLPPEPPKTNNALWLLPIALLVAVGGFWVYVAFFAGSTPATTTTLSALETTTTTDALNTTTVPDVTTTTASTTTTLQYPPPSTWPAVGDPVAREDLGLAAAGIGPIDFGVSTAEAAGILTSSLGQAEAAGNDDACQTGDVYWLQWGPLRAIFNGFADSSTFTAFRYENAGGSADIELATLSGVTLGDTVETLQDTYTSYTVTFEVIDGQDNFRLADGGELLLWGPVSSTDPDGIIEGIYSPTLCEGG